MRIRVERPNQPPSQGSLLGRENLGTRLGPYLPDISSDAKITSQIFLAV